MFLMRLIFLEYIIYHIFSEIKAKNVKNRRIGSSDTRKFF